MEEITMSTPVQEAAKLYISKHWQVVPLAAGSKVCKDEGWKNLVFRPEDFRDDDNIGIRSVNGLIVIDEDCAEAIACADVFFPPTGAIYGRESKPRSKRLYVSTFEKTIAFKDTEIGTTIIEIRAQHQDMAPPSYHPDSELLMWVEPLGDASPVDAATLLRAARLTATCSLVSRYYNPPGSRHDWCLALSGVLRSLDITQDECVKILKCAAQWANDDKISDRVLEVRSTYERPDDDPMMGPRVFRNSSDHGKAMITSLSRIWGAASGAFLMDEKGERILANNQENIRRALKKLEVGLSFNVFAQKPIVFYEKYNGTMNDVVVNRIWLEIDSKFHFRPTKDFFFDVLQDISHLNPFHPVLDYLRGVEWDGLPRVNEWLIKSAGAHDSEYTRAVSALVLIAAVRRVTKPGCKFDEMLVLESGQQGLMKSTAIQTLCPEHTWFSDDLPLNVDAKQIVERTLGKWIIEASDLSGMRPASVEHLKGMLSRQVDGPVRLAYGRLPIEQRRQFIIIGTTNNHVYLTDSTGNRRFWPVRVEKFDIDWLRANRDQMWAEAFSREQKGESIRLKPELYKYAEMQQERRRGGDPWEEVLGNHYHEEYYRVTPAEVWSILGIPVERQDERSQLRISRVMQGLGFKRISVKDPEKKVIRGWGKGSKLLDEFPSRYDE
jgi:predicted P-loop ATPase